MTQPQMPTMPTVDTGAQPSAMPTQQPPHAQQQGGNQNNSIKVIGRVNFPTTQLFEATGFIDISKQYPKSNAFLMFMPGQADNTKLSGRTYLSNQSETMKINIRDLFALAEAIKYAAMYKQNPDFIIFTDSNKYAGTQQGQGTTKKVTVTTMPSSKDPNKYKIFLTYNGQKKINLALDQWHAIGLAEELKSLATKVNEEKFAMEMN